MFKITIFLLFITNLSLAHNINLNLTSQEKKYILDNPTISVANELDWIPYDYYEKGEAKGFVIDYIKLLLSKFNLKAEFVSNNWPTLLNDFKKGNIDLLPVIGFNKHRENFISYSYAYSKQEFSLVTNISRYNLFTLDDLKGKTLAVHKNSALSRHLKKYYPNIKQKEFDNVTEMFTAVKNNVVDGTIQNKIISRYYVNTFHNTTKVISTINFPLYDNNLYIGLQKNNEILTSIINKAIHLVSDDELYNLEQKWSNINKTLYFTDKEKEFIKNTIINIGYTDNWAPFSFEENGMAYGLGFDFWQYILEKTNIKYNLKFKSNFSYALEDFKNNRVDILLTTSKTKDREKYAIFSDIYHKSPIGLATTKDKNYIPNIESIKGKKIGVGKNFTAHRLLKERYPNLNFVFVQNIQDGLKQLSENKIYALADNIPVLAHNIQKHSFSNIKISGNSGIDFNLRIMIRQDYQMLQTIINKVLNSMAPHEKSNIYNKWAKIHYEQKINYSELLKYIVPLFLIIAYILYKNQQLQRTKNSLKKAQKALNNSLESFKAVVDMSIEGLLIVENEKLLFTNTEAEKMFNLSEEEFKQIDFYSLFNKNKTYIKDIISKNFEETYELDAYKNKKKFPILLRSREIVFENKKCLILSIFDLSEIKEKENRLIQQSKMASLGEMIGNIAHQWRQPLSFISTAASGVKMQKEFNQLSDELFYEAMDNIKDTTKFLSQTIDDFQDFLKRDKNKKEFLLKDCVNKIVNIVSSSLENNFIKFTSDIEKNLTLDSYENELNQVLLNIINNSKDALKDKHTTNDKHIHLKAYTRKDKTYIEIIDNGGGIDSEVLKKVFEPYYTTKHKSQGTGLGLYMTHKIINESLQGNIIISNTSYELDSKFYEKCTMVKIELTSFIED